MKTSLSYSCSPRETKSVLIASMKNKLRLSIAGSAVTRRHRGNPFRIAAVGGIAEAMP
jgi:hypothetical protein